MLNSSLTFTEAMIQSPIEDAGYANADPGSVMDFVFVPGVVNIPGPDLVLFDLQYDIGVYRFATNYDAFATEILVDTAGGTVVTTQDYYYELGPAFPSTEDVVGVEIDLDALGVPEGEAVIGFRLIADNVGCDPVSLTKLDRFALAVAPLSAGGTASFETSGGTPGGTIGIGYSLLGNGPAKPHPPSAGKKFLAESGFARGQLFPALHGTLEIGLDLAPLLLHRGDFLAGLAIGLGVRKPGIDGFDPRLSLFDPGP